MANNTRKKPSMKVLATARQEARLALLRRYDRLHQEWNYELQNDSTDWERLFSLYYSLKEAEQRNPWLKKEALA